MCTLPAQGSAARSSSLALGRGCCMGFRHLRTWDSWVIADWCCRTPTHDFAAESEPAVAAAAAGAAAVSPPAPQPPREGGMDENRRGASRALQLWPHPFPRHGGTRPRPSPAGGQPPCVASSAGVPVAAPVAERHLSAAAHTAAAPLRRAAWPRSLLPAVASARPAAADPARAAKRVLQHALPPRPQSDGLPRTGCCPRFQPVARQGTRVCGDAAPRGARQNRKARK